MQICKMLCFETPMLFRPRMAKTVEKQEMDGLIALHRGFWKTLESLYFEALTSLPPIQREPLIQDS